MNPSPPTTPLADLAAWTQWFATAEIPVLARTVRTLEALRDNEDAVDAHTLGSIINEDPLMTLKVLVHAATYRRDRLVTDVETVTAALILMGITPFFGFFTELQTVEDRLSASPQALTGLNEVLRRAHRAANFVLGFSVHRMDPNAHIVQHAALLHSTAEMLLWCHAPALALRIRRAQQLDGSLRSIVAQREILNIELPTLQRSLMQGWGFPPMFTQAADDASAGHSGVRSVALSVRLARHTALGWNNPALDDDIADISHLLNLSNEATLHLLQQLDS